MFAILKKELTLFFSTAMGYLVSSIFLVITGLFLWVLDTDFNLLNAGFADLNAFFFLAPWVFIFLIPAITMRSFSDEMNAGTMEILKTTPLSTWDIVWGKYTGAFILSLLTLIPTLVYVYSIYSLSSPQGNIDLASLLGAYVGLLCMLSTYVAIGVFSSTLSSNQIITFITAISLTLFLYMGFDAIASLFPNYAIGLQKFGMFVHYKSIGSGVLDSRSLLYFLSLSGFFLVLTKHQISKKISVKQLATYTALLLALNIVSSHYYTRIDFTEDQRYSLSSTSKSILEKITKPLLITVYLKGDFPAEFKRLQLETAQFLEELTAANHLITTVFIDPTDQLEKLVQTGLKASRLQVQENGKVSEVVMLPWAVIKYGGKRENIALLKDSHFNSQEQQLENSVQHLEYAFANALLHLTHTKSKKIAILKGNGELEDVYLADFLGSLKASYRLAPFTLDAVQDSPEKTLAQLLDFDAVIIAKPTLYFSEKEKYVLDQFICQGGKTLWLIDNVQASLDSLMTSGEAMVFPRDLNLTDLLFSYGVRIQQNLVQDLYSSKITLATGNIGNQTQFDQFLWNFNPLVKSPLNHPITHNIEPVNLRFVSSIDTLKNEVKKTILLQSSALSKTVGTPRLISLNSLATPPNPETFTKRGIPVAVLLEGRLKSAYKRRVKPFPYAGHIDDSSPNKMIVISDGDIIANEVRNGKPQELGQNKWTQEIYGNKEFLLNALNYLLDDTGLIQIRSKEISLKYLDKQQAFENRTYWQTLNMMVPLLLLALFGGVFWQVRKRKYHYKNK